MRYLTVIFAALVLAACSMAPVTRSESQAAIPTQAQVDAAAIRATALDYIEGWYTGDAVRMERSLHPHLAKRFVEPRADGGVQLTETSALELVQQVRNGGGSGTPENKRRTDVRILDIFQNVASVRVDAHGWVDYMHLAKIGGKWRIVNVLWEIRRPPPDHSSCTAEQSVKCTEP